jgi:hypothetical protein
MKILITESQKKKLLNDFIKSLVDDTLDENEPSYLDSYIVFWDKTVDGDIDDATAIEYDKSDGRLWISKKYLNNLESWFPIKKEKVLDMIKNSFENKFNVDVKYIKAES